jgi:hypothetical protein
LDQLEARLFFFLKQLDLEVDKKIDPPAGKNRSNFSCPWIFFDFRRNLSKLKIEIKSKIRWTECDKLLAVKLIFPLASITLVTRIYCTVSATIRELVKVLS